MQACKMLNEYNNHMTMRLIIPPAFLETADGSRLEYVEPVDFPADFYSRPNRTSERKNAISTLIISDPLW